MQIRGAQPLHFSPALRAANLGQGRPAAAPTAAVSPASAPLPAPAAPSPMPPAPPAPPASTTPISLAAPLPGTNWLASAAPPVGGRMGASNLMRSLATARAAAVPAADDSTSQRFTQLVQRDFAHWDGDDDGELSVAELQTAIANPQVKGENAAALAEVFQQLQASGAATFTSDDLDRDRADIAEGKTRMGGSDGFADNLQALQDSRSNMRLFGDGAPSLDAINQGKLNDCWALSSLGSLVNTDPEALKQMIHRNGDGSYTVNTPGGGRQQVSALTDGELALGNRSEGNGVWANVMEKAIGEQMHQRQPGKFTGDDGVAAMTSNQAFNAEQILTGTRGQRTTFKPTGNQPGSSPEQVRSVLQSAVSDGQLAVAGARDASDGLDNQHAYAVIGFDPGSDTVTLRNPWGVVVHANQPLPADVSDLGDGLFGMKFADFYTQFNALDVAAAAPGQ